MSGNLRRQAALRASRFALVLGLCLFGAPLAAQVPAGVAAVRGNVTTPAGEPIAMAIVELRTRRDSAIVRSGQTGPSGRFQLDGIAAGVYHLLIRRIGFGPAITPDFTVTDGQVRDLGQIKLEAIAVQLAPIEVTVERPDIVFEPDRTGYLVEALTGAAGGVLTDALRGIPDLAVDIDGTIRYRGNTPAIYLNGRPAPMQGVSLAVFLEQFPADRIERIEVLDAPPARFSAEGGAGVINIVLKQGVELGLTGSVSLAAGTRGQYTASGHTTFQKGRLVLNTGVNARWSDSRSSDFTLRQNLLADPVTFLQQDARSDRSNGNGGFSLDLRYDFSKRSRLFSRFFGNLSGNDRRGVTETQHLDDVRLPTLGYDRLNRQDGDGGSFDARVGYGYAWVPERHTLELELYAQRNSNRNKTREETVADSIFQDAELLPPWLTRRDDGSSSTGIGLDLNYARPFGRQGRIELGSGVRRNSSEDDQTTRLFENVGATLPDFLEERLISRVQRTGSAYLTLQQRFGKFGLMLGLRGELVADRVLLPEGTEVDRDEANLFPSVNLNWNPRQRMGVRAGFSLRVNRPGVSILDPTNRSTDPLNRSVGNPDIKSSITRSINLGFSWAGRLGQVSISPNWNQTSDGWERVTTVDSLGVATSTYQNLTSRTSLGVSLGFGPPPLKGWNGRLNLSANRSTLSGTLRPVGLESGELRWSLGANLNGPIVRGITGQGSFGYEPGRDLIQGRTTGQFRADFSFRYRLMNNRTSVAMSFQDPFELRRTTQQIRDPSVIQTGSTRITTRAVSLNVSYAFGGGRGSGNQPRAAMELKH